MSTSQSVVAQEGHCVSYHIVSITGDSCREAQRLFRHSSRCWTRFPQHYPSSWSSSMTTRYVGIVWLPVTADGHLSPFEIRKAESRSVQVLIEKVHAILTRRGKLPYTIWYSLNDRINAKLGRFDPSLPRITSIRSMARLAFLYTSGLLPFLPHSWAFQEDIYLAFYMEVGTTGHLAITKCRAWQDTAYAPWPTSCCVCLGVYPTDTRPCYRPLTLCSFMQRSSRTSRSSKTGSRCPIGGGRSFCGVSISRCPESPYRIRRQIAIPRYLFSWGRTIVSKA